MDCESYEIIKLLGEGTYGKVNEVVDKRTGKHYAMKTYLSKIIDGDAVREIDIMKRVNHRNILNAIEVYSTDRSTCVITELATSSLQDYLKKFTLSDDNTLFKIYELLCGIQYLHKNFIIHRDLKPDNILIVDGVLRIGDFGSAVIAPSNVVKHDEEITSLLWRAPELMVKQSTLYSNAIDMWAAGIIIDQIIRKASPRFSRFGDRSITATNLVLNISRQIPLPEYMRMNVYPETKFDPKKFENIPPKYRSFVLRLLSPDPSMRPTADEALEDPLFSKFNCQQIDIIYPEIKIDLIDEYRSVRRSLVINLYNSLRIRYIKHNKLLIANVWFLVVDILDRFYTFINRVKDPKRYVESAIYIASSIYGIEEYSSLPIMADVKYILFVLDFKIFRPNINIYSDIDMDDLINAYSENPTPTLPRTTESEKYIRTKYTRPIKPKTLTKKIKDWGYRSIVKPVVNVFRKTTISEPLPISVPSTMYNIPDVSDVETDVDNDADIYLLT